jgi:hypothetical protein
LLMLGLAALVDRGLHWPGWLTLAALGVVSVIVQVLGIVVSCIPYASRMLATEASADRLIWHAGFSPLAEHARSLVARDLPLHLAPVFFQSRSLAWFQAAAFVAGCALLIVYLRSISREVRIRVSDGTLRSPDTTTTV